MFDSLHTALETLEPRLLLTTGTAYLDLQIDQTDHTFAVYADASTGDNLGIAGFDITISNVTTANMDAPYVYDPAVKTTRGFFLQQFSPQSGEAFGGQNVANSNSLIYGVGQTAGTINGTSWDAHVLLVDGTYTGNNLPAIDFAGATVNVFSLTHDGQSDSSTVLPFTDELAASVQDAEVDHGTLYNSPSLLSYDSLDPSQLGTQHSFMFSTDLVPGNFSYSSITLTTPDNQIYALSQTAHTSTTQTWGMFTADPADLAHFTDGTYTLNLTLGSTTVQVPVQPDNPADGQPIAPVAEKPVITSPLLGSFGSSLTPTIQWQAVDTTSGDVVDLTSDPAVTSIQVMLKDLTADHVVAQATLTDTSATSWSPTPPNLTANHVYLATVTFMAEDTGTLDNVSMTNSTSSYTGTVFNTVPSPFTSITQVSMDTGVVHNGSGTTTYSFDFNVAASSSSWMKAAYLQTPDGTWRQLDWLSTNPWTFHVESTTAADMSAYTDGVYTLWIDKGSDVYATTTFNFQNVDQPNQTPVLVSPAQARPMCRTPRPSSGKPFPVIQVSKPWPLSCTRRHRRSQPRRPILAI